MMLSFFMIFYDKKTAQYAFSFVRTRIPSPLPHKVESILRRQCYITL